MLGQSSPTSSWEQLELPTYVLNKKLYCQARLSDHEVILLYDQIDEPSKIKGFAIFNFKKSELSRLEGQVEENEFTSGSCYMYCEGNIIVVLIQGFYSTTLWKFKVAQNNDAISSLSQYTVSVSGNIPKNIGVLYHQHFYLQRFKPTEQLLIINTSTGILSEPQVTGRKPEKRDDYYTTLYQNEMFLFGGQVDNSYCADIWALNLDTLQWREAVCELAPFPRSLALACSFGNKIFVFGGQTKIRPNSSRMESKELFSYDPVSNIWEKIKTTNKGLSGSTDTGEYFVSLKEGFLLLTWGKYYNQFLALKNSDEEEQGSKESIDYHLRIKQKNLYEKKPFPDVTFRVEQQEISAHKGVLSAGCKFFENMFTSGMEESANKVIDVPDMRFAVFTALLQYIYRSTVKVDEEIARDLFEAADKYLLPELMKVCEDFLSNNIKATNVVELIKLAEKYGAESLRKAALKYVVDNIDIVFEVANIKDLEVKTLLEICKMPK